MPEFPFDLYQIYKQGRVDGLRNVKWSESTFIQSLEREGSGDFIDIALFEVYAAGYYGESFEVALTYDSP